MSHSFCALYIHLVFRVAGIRIKTEDIEPMHAYMRGILDNCGCTFITVGGIEDHVHILAQFPIDRIRKITSTVKTTATHWLKRRDVEAYNHFSWQQGSGIFSVSFSVVEKVRQYILTQREHHCRINAKQELDRLEELHRLS